MKYAIQTLLFFMVIFSIIFWMDGYQLTINSFKFLYGFYGGWIAGDYMRVFKKKIFSKGINVYRNIGQIVGFLIVAIVWPWSMFVVARQYHKNQNINQ